MSGAQMVLPELANALQWRMLAEPDRLLDDLRSEIQWRSEHLTMFGKKIEVSRQVAWNGEAGCSYRYSGIDHPAMGWSKTLKVVRDEVAAFYQRSFNFVLLNRYRTGHDYMGWHADDEPELAGDVCSVSLGATRRLRLQLPDGSRQGVDLPHGSCICIPRHWRHTLTRTKRPVGARINLSFRNICA